MSAFAKDEGHADSAFTSGHTAALTAGSASLTAALLWVASGVLNRLLLANVGRVPYQVVNLMVPSALDFNLRPGEYQVSVMAVVGAVAMVLVVAGITYLAVRGLRPGQGRVTLFFAAWFAAVAGSAVGATVQVLQKFLSGASPGYLRGALNGLIPYVTGGGYWGMALGWVIGVAAVITFTRSGRAHQAHPEEVAPLR